MKEVSEKCRTGQLYFDIVMLSIHIRRATWFYLRSLHSTWGSPVYSFYADFVRMQRTRAGPQTVIRKEHTLFSRLSMVMRHTTHSTLYCFLETKTPMTGRRIAWESFRLKSLQILFSAEVRSSV